MVEVKISKNNIFVVIAVIAFLGSIFAVYAYGTSNPAVFGHSAGEIEGIGSGGTSCASGQIAVGSSCKSLPSPSCTVSQALSYDGNSFSCKDVTLTAPAYKWTKVCGKTTTSGAGVCASVGGTYGRDLTYAEPTATYLLNSPTKNCIGVSEANKAVRNLCVAGEPCTPSTTNKYCVVNFNVISGNNYVSNFCGNMGTYVYTSYGAGEIYMCMP